MNLKNHHKMIFFTGNSMKFKYLLLPYIFLVINCTSSNIHKPQNNLNNQFKINNTYLNNKPEILKKNYRDLYLSSKKDKTLFNLILGLKAFANGYYNEATFAFDDALNSIETIYGNNENALKARSLWYEEKEKDFKGEPYERVMAYFYRGLISFIQKDYENARTLFKSGIIQDAFAEEEQNRCDFALMLLFEGLSSKLMGDNYLAQLAFDELKKIRPDLKLPDNFNFILIAETGKSPRKVADGVGHGELKYRRGRNFKDVTTFVNIDNSGFQPLYPVEDIYWQAATRGGRAVDKILEGKVIFKKKNAKIGSTLSEISTNAIVMAPLFENSAALRNTGAVLGIFGAIYSMRAIKAKPHADIRFWNNLPDSVHIFIGKLNDGSHSLKIKFKDINNNFIENIQKEKNIIIKNNNLNITWVASRNFN